MGKRPLPWYRSYHPSGDMSVLRLRTVEEILLVALSAVCSGCAGAGSPSSGAPGHPPERIISLSPTVTETLFEIGAGDALIGRTQWGNFPPEADAVPSVGDGLNPNIEVLVARQPDLVIFYPSAMNGAAMRRLTDLGIATSVLRTDRLSDVVTVTRELGRLTGHTDSADVLAVRFQNRIDSLSNTRLELDVTVLILAWWDPPIAIGHASFQHEMVEIAGAHNIFSDIRKPSAQVSIEEIASRDPELVIVFGRDDIPEFVTRPEWQVVEAVKNRRLLVFNGSEFARPSLRIPAAIAKIRLELERMTGR